jgi:alpha-beta hydrolase superfamily lysophospholipase
MSERIRRELEQLRAWIGRWTAGGEAPASSTEEFSAPIQPFASSGAPATRSMQGSDPRDSAEAAGPPSGRWFDWTRFVERLGIGPAADSPPETAGAGAARVDGDHRMVTVRDGSDRLASLHVVEYPGDDPQRPVVLLLPFTTAHTRQLRPIALALQANGAHAVAVDPPGHGRSAGARGEFSIDSLLDWLADLAAVYRWRHPGRGVLLAGSSMGGDLALLTALREEERFRREGRPPALAGVVGQGVITPWQRDLFRTFRTGVGVLFDEDEPGLAGLAAELVRRGIGERLPRDRMFRAGDLYDDAERRAYWRRDPLVLRDYDTASYLAYLRHRPSVRYRDLELPVLLLHGDRDRLIAPDYARAVQSSLTLEHSRTEAMMISGAAHAMFEEMPADTAERMLEWWERAASTRDRRRHRTEWAETIPYSAGGLTSSNPLPRGVRTQPSVGIPGERPPPFTGLRLMKPDGTGNGPG